MSRRSSRRARLHPDLVLLDVNLPDIDGFDVAQRITADPRRPGGRARLQPRRARTSGRSSSAAARAGSSPRPTCRAPRSRSVRAGDVAAPRAARVGAARRSAAVAACSSRSSRRATTRAAKVADRDPRAVLIGLAFIGIGAVRLVAAPAQPLRRADDAPSASPGSSAGAASRPTRRSSSRSARCSAPLYLVARRAHGARVPERPAGDAARARDRRRRAYLAVLRSSACRYFLLGGDVAAGSRSTRPDNVLRDRRRPRRRRRLRASSTARSSVVGLLAARRPAAAPLARRRRPPQRRAQAPVLCDRPGAARRCSARSRSWPTPLGRRTGSCGRASARRAAGLRRCCRSRSSPACCAAAASRAGAVGELVERLTGRTGRAPLREALATRWATPRCGSLYWLPESARLRRPRRAPGRAARRRRPAAGRRPRSSATARASARSSTTASLSRSPSSCAPSRRPPRWRWRTSAWRPSCGPASRSCERSRDALIEVGLSERRRLERDLHDGAQQRLVALSLQLGLARAKLDQRPARRPRRCSTAPARSCARRSRSCASSPAASTRPCSPTAGSARARGARRARAASGRPHGDARRAPARVRPL